MRTRPTGTAGSCGACTSAPRKTGGTPETPPSPSGLFHYSRRWVIDDLDLIHVIGCSAGWTCLGAVANWGAGLKSVLNICVSFAHLFIFVFISITLGGGS